MASNLRFELEIVQQPIRARMCGFGDKDRRQVSPPPFIKLNIFDTSTGEPIDVEDIDINPYVLVVELWSKDEKEDLTLNQNIATNPSTINKTGQDTHSSTISNESTKIEEIPANSKTTDSDDSLGDIPTRNLIGNHVINPFKLYDDKQERGIWFILHDLSIRIEGEFKLKFLFVDLVSNHSVFKFSNSFKVYSAKKFPGVVDSSPLGRVFASQGLKIPIRRESQPDK